MIGSRKRVVKRWGSMLAFIPLSIRSRHLVDAFFEIWRDPISLSDREARLKIQSLPKTNLLTSFLLPHLSANRSSTSASTVFFRLSKALAPSGVFPESNWSIPSNRYLDSAQLGLETEHSFKSTKSRLRRTVCFQASSRKETYFLDPTK